MRTVRILLRAPLFSGGVILTLGLALSAAVVAFTLADRVLWRPLPLAGAAAVVGVNEADGRGGTRLASYPTFEDWKRGARGLQGLAFVRGETRSLGPTGARQRVVVALVTAGYMEVAGVRTRVGRGFLPAEEAPTGGGVVMISEAVWASQFARDPGVIGRTMLIDGTPQVVVGVVPESQRFFGWEEVWMPVAPALPRIRELENRFLHVDSRVLARLAPGTTRQEAERDLSGLQHRLASAYPDPGGTFDRVGLTPIKDMVIGTAGGALTALAAAMLLVLVLACANVSGLVLLRTARREREFTVRTALGAPFGALVRQLVSESLVLSLAAGGLAMALATVVLGLLRSTPSLGIPRSAELGLDLRAGTIALGLSLLVGVLVGMLPAWRLRGVVARGAQQGTRGVETGGAHARRLRSAITALQLGVALTLLVGAGLVLRAFERVQGADLGYRPEQVMALDVYPAPHTADEDAARTLFRRLVDEASAIPGVQAAAFINHVPLGGAINTRITVPGVEPDPNGADVALYKTASEAYATAVGLRLVRGRWFTRAEVDARAPVVVVGEGVARRFWPAGDPVGRAMTVYRSSQARPGFGDPQPVTVIGVVAPVRHFGPAADPVAEAYLPFTREAWGWGSIVARSALPPDVVRRGLEGAFRAVDPELPLGGATGGGFRVLADGVASFMAPRRLSTALAGGLAAVALLVASLGLYAVVAYAVAQRTAEFGVRLALGATRGSLVARVLRDGGRLALAGFGIGVVGAVALGRLLASQLAGASPTDPVAYAGAAAVLAVTLFVALWIPARRAASLDPSDALRRD